VLGEREVFKNINEHRTKDQESTKGLIKALKQVRPIAAKQPGFISWNIYVDAADLQHVMIITTWDTRKNWEDWDKSAARASTRKIVEPHLAESFNAITLEAPIIFRDEQAASATK
jgi:heme-degrading monooxygenase HmoA